MAEITDKEMEALQDGFDTMSLVHAVDELDKILCRVTYLCRD